MKKSILLSLVAAGLLAFASPSHAATLFIDFGDGNATNASDPSSNYNSILVAPVSPDNLVILNAIDSTGAPTGIGVSASGFYQGSNTTGTTTPTGDAAIFTAQATRDNAFGHALAFGTSPLTPLATVVFSGLDASGSTSYNFTMFGSRTGVTDNRETKYELNGANSGVSYLDTAKTPTTGEVAVVAGIIPNANGEIVLSVSPGPNNNNSSRFYYLGALRLESVTGTIPEPASCGMLVLCGLALVSRRSWR